MYDSRSSHPRTGSHWHREWQRKSTGGTRYEGVQAKQDFTPKRLRQLSASVAIAEALEEAEVEQVERLSMAAAHAEALRLNAMLPWERDDAMYGHDHYAHEPLAAWERALLLDMDMDGDSEAVWSTEFDAVHEMSMREWERLDLERERENDARYDHAYGGYSDDAYVEDGEYVIDCWMPYMRMDEVRETFGENWLGNGFHVISPNTIRRTK